MSLAQYISKVSVYCGLQIAFKIATILNIVLFYESMMALLLIILFVTTDIYEKEKRDMILIYGECNKNYSAATRLCHIVCSTKNSLAASHDKSEVCLSTRCEMNY
jgi:hypothetical protein